MSNPLTNQEGGDHYKNLNIQPVEYIHANELGFIEGCIVKYATRHRSKNGAEDVKKIIHFAELLLELEYKHVPTVDELPSMTRAGNDHTNNQLRK